MAMTMIDRVEVQPDYDPIAAYRSLLALTAELIERINRLDARMDELEAWLGEVADDVLDREGVAP